MLSDDQYERLKRELEDTYQGARNAGRPLLLEGGLDWKPMSLSPKDMDFMEAKHAAAREIALAFGVPPMLLGIPGDNTYSNYREANRAFWRQTVLPLARGSAPRWRSGWRRRSARACACHRHRPYRRAVVRSRGLWERVTKAPFLTINEKREAVGYGPVDGGDRLA